MNLTPKWPIGYRSTAKDENCCVCREYAEKNCVYAGKNCRHAGKNVDKPGLSVNMPGIYIKTCRENQQTCSVRPHRAYNA